jgi:hypothetical protein
MTKIVRQITVDGHEDEIDELVVAITDLIDGKPFSVACSAILSSLLMVAVSCEDDETMAVIRQSARWALAEVEGTNLNS